MRLERLGALHLVERALDKGLNLHNTLSVMSDGMVAQTVADASDVLLLDQEKNELRYFAGSGFRSALIRTSRCPLGEGCVGSAAFEQRRVAVPDLASSGFRRLQMVEEEGFSSYVGVPLLIANRLRGVVEVFNRTQTKGDGEWFDLLRSIAARAEVAIEMVESSGATVHSIASLTSNNTISLEALLNDPRL